MYSNVMWKSVNLILANSRLICPTVRYCSLTSNQGILGSDALSSLVHNFKPCKLTAECN